MNGFETVLHRLAIVVGDATADLEHKLAQFGSEGHFNETGVGHVPGKCKGLGSRRLRGSDAAEGLSAFVDDARNMGQRLHVVDDRGLAPESALRREGRFRRRHTAPAFNRGDHGSFFTAHKRTGAFEHVALQR